MVSLSLGAPLDPGNLIKGSDVYLECDIRANPPAKLIEWYHNVSQLRPQLRLRLQFFRFSFGVCFLRV